MYEDRQPDDDPDDNPVPTNISNAIFLGIMYSATIGGCCTVIGTGTNLVLQGALAQAFPDAPELDFASFMAYSTPVMFVLNMLAWTWIQVLHLGMFRPGSELAKQGDLGVEGNRILQETVERKYLELGSISSHESWVLGLFLCAVFLWFFRSPGFIDGWAPWFSTEHKIKDSTATLLVVALMFIVPSKWSWLNCLSCDKGERPQRPASAHTHKHQYHLCVSVQINFRKRTRPAC